MDSSGSGKGQMAGRLFEHGIELLGSMNGVIFVD
jgi:hypothetical protein